MGLSERIWEALAIAVLFAALAALATWPMPTNPARLDLARPGHNDVRFNTYLIFWGAHALTTDPLHLHHTNMFHPEKWTFAYSDIELSHSLLMMPVILAFRNPVLTYNLLLLLSMVLGGLGFFLLARDLTGHRGAALLGAAFFVFNPAVFGRFLQIQLFCGHWMPWLAWATLRWLRGLESEGGNWRWAFGTVIFYCLNALSGSHYAVFGTALVAGLVLYEALIHRLWAKTRFWLQCIAMTASVLVVLVPVFWPYLIVESELAAQRVSTVSALEAGSAGPLELFSSNSRLYRWLRESFGWPLASIKRWPRSFLFPGASILALAAIGFITRREKGADDSRTGLMRWLAWALDFAALAAAWSALVVAFTGSRSLVLLIFTVPAKPAIVFPAIAVAAVVSRLLISPMRATDHIFVALTRFVRKRVRSSVSQLFWLLLFIFSLLAALGPAAGMYHLIARLPLIKMIRVPGRFMILATFALAVLASFGAAAIARRQAGRKKTVVVMCIVTVLFAAESFYFPLHVRPFDPEPPPLYSWLGEREGDFAVAEYPIYPKDYGISARQVYYSIYHWKKLLVGYSGYQSGENVSRLRRLDAAFPDNRCLDELEGLSVRYVVVFEGRVGPATLAAVREQGRLVPVRRFGSLAVYRLRPSAGG